ncbi:hypothetical protein GCK72_012391 [Caenorhabditis remanei]|uniref:Uncharacterized protein n=1 Tax=Caenorhabditis remanei TaxID=31234 RepID=A0A6A5GKT4_CAERE|nr:hypothetical protein GCK72_012391 [Caenorhabditis remanei]KAF1755938.1 hypothetical protein GCK72_012391 [Caenorhabditis remanei]
MSQFPRTHIFRNLQRSDVRVKMSSNPQEYVAPGTKESCDFDSSEHNFKCETTNSTTMTTVCRVDRSRSSSGNSIASSEGNRVSSFASL